jgi:sulfur-carrier protein adenylyltransferase/sulfurtransferase
MKIYTMPAFSDFELQKYKHLIDLPEPCTEDHEKLKEARVLVIGAGNCGRISAMHLAKSGAGTIGIADYARVEIRDQGNDILPIKENAGKFKTQAVLEEIRNKYPVCLITCHNITISKLNIVDIVSSYDVVLDCTNDSLTHYLLSDVTELIDLPMIFGAVSNAFGLLSVFNFAGGPSFRCLPEEVLKVIEQVSGNDFEKPAYMTEIIGLLQACEAITIITGHGEVLSSSLIKIDSVTHESEKIFFSFPPGYKASGIRSDYGNESDLTLPVITPAELRSEMEAGSRFSVFDIRPPEQFIKFNIGGMNVRADYLLNNPEDIPVEGKVIIICSLGDESRAIVDYLRNNENLTNVFNLEGGIQGWQNR